jgi:hypothetical protein
MRATIDYDQNVITMAKIGATYTMFDDTPVKSNAAPSSGTGNPQAFVTTPADNADPFQQ